MAGDALAELGEEFARRYRWVRDRIPIDSGNYPYVTARVRAKRASLVPEETYGRLLQMSIPEIARFLGEREYKAEHAAGNRSAIARHRRAKDIAAHGEHQSVGHPDGSETAFHRAT